MWCANSLSKHNPGIHACYAADNQITCYWLLPFHYLSRKSIFNFTQGTNNYTTLTNWSTFHYSNTGLCWLLSTVTIIGKSHLSILFYSDHYWQVPFKYSFLQWPLLASPIWVFVSTVTIIGKSHLSTHIYV